MRAFSVLVVSILVLAVNAKDECMPSTWTKANQARAAPTGLLSPVNSTVKFPSILTTGENISVGDLVCRAALVTDDTVNYYTCRELAKHYQVTLEKFFRLNPTLKPDCSNIKPNAEYCYAGFFEPLRATDGLCGPLHKNATCRGTDFGYCCNSKTWKCGGTPEDCAPGTCYDGVCPGDKVYSTDGTCGPEHGMRLCAGVQGDCCSKAGRCGTGEAFCGIDNCMMGNCTRPPSPAPTTPSWMLGNTTDGTCGGTNRYVCNVVYGNCCNKDGICGSLPMDCGEGCQSEFGSCSSSSSSSFSATTAPTTSKSTSTVPKTTSTAPITSKPTATTPKTTPNVSTLPTCGQTCIKNMLGQYAALGCSSPDPACLCQNANFGYGIRDCANGACGNAVGSTVIAYGSALCSGIAVTTAKPSATTATGVAALPSCGQLCFSNMVAQHSALGCASADPYCLCKNANFGYGLRDCANGACGTAVAPTVIAFGSSYCASASATATGKH